MASQCAAYPLSGLHRLSTGDVPCPFALPHCRSDLVREGLSNVLLRDSTWAEPEHALGRQLYALRRWSGMSVIVYTG